MINTSRRDFVKQCAAGCLLCSLGTRASETKEAPDLSDLSKVTYCGYQCTDECALLAATKENDPELKATSARGCSGMSVRVRARYPSAAWVA